MSKPINKTKTIKASKKDKICAKGNTTYEVSWLYTTNRSGDYEFLYTGKELGKDFMDSDKTIKAGDRVLYKNKSHQNNKVKAKVIEIISSLSKSEAAAKGTTPEKFGKIYKLKFLNPPIVKQKQIKTLTVTNKMLIEKIPHHKDYICLKKGENLKDKIENKAKKNFLTEKFYKNSGEKQMPFIIEKVLAKETSGKEVLDLNEMVPPTANYIIQSISFKGLGKARKSKKYSNKNNDYYRIKGRVHLSLKDKDKPFDISNISGFLACDNHKQEIANIFNSWRNDSYTYVTNITKKPRERALTRKKKKAMTKLQAVVRGKQTRKKKLIQKKRKKANDKTRKRAAKKIQSLMRGIKTRKNLDGKKLQDATIQKKQEIRDKTLFPKELKKNDKVRQKDFEKQVEESDATVEEMEERLRQLAV